MKFLDSPWLKRLFAPPRPEPAQQAQRIVAMQLNVVLPAKAGILGVILFYLFSSGWQTEKQSLHSVALDFLNRFYIVYIAFSVIAAGMFFLHRRFPAGMFRWVVFVVGIFDGLFVASLVFLTDGFGSIAYWIFPALIVLNALSIPLAVPQFVLNLLLGFFYLIAGILYAEIPPTEIQLPPVALFRTPPTHPGTNAAPPGSNSPVRINPINVLQLPVTPQSSPVVVEPDFPKLFLLWLLGACCYGVQLLAERERRAVDESREFAVREAQLRSAGRLAAEFAHQIKNPLAIINNAVFSLHRALKEGRDVNSHLEIIREEIDRSDRIITEVMGYAQLTEGRVEKLNLIETLDQAILEAFPPAVTEGIKIERRYDDEFPPVLMQQQHLSQIFLNILLNARQAVGEKGEVKVIARLRSDSSTLITISDSGPGIPPDKIEKIFEAYYTTKQKGTGLGLAIVKHNTELYGGSVRVESELGKGARFTLVFPAKTAMNLAS